MFRLSNKVFFASVLDVSKPSSFSARFLRFFRGDFVVESDFRFLLSPGSNFLRFFFFFESSPSPAKNSSLIQNINLRNEDQGEKDLGNMILNATGHNIQQ